MNSQFTKTTKKPKALQGGSKAITRAGKQYVAVANQNLDDSTATQNLAAGADSPRTQLLTIMGYEYEESRDSVEQEITSLQTANRILANANPNLFAPARATLAPQTQVVLQQAAQPLANVVQPTVPQQLAQPLATAVQPNVFAALQVPLKPQTKVSPMFEGAQPLRINERHIMGVQGKELLIKLYGHLGPELKLLQNQTHDHSLCAFARKFLNRMVHSGLTDKNLIDIGGHAIRTATTDRWIDGYLSPCHKTIHSILPMIPGLDEYRHRNWRHSLRNRKLAYKNDPSVQVKHLIPNACDKLADGRSPLCNCFAANPNELYEMEPIMVDSIYYPNVQVSAELHLYKALLHHEANKQPHSHLRGYAIFHDYKRAIDKGISYYKTPDDECEVKINHAQFLVSSSVNGNTGAYEHGILDTGNGQTWAIYRPSPLDHDKVYRGFTAVYNVVHRIPLNKHDYVLATIDVFHGKITGIPYVPSERLTPVEPVVEDVRLNTNSLTRVLEFTKEFISTLPQKSMKSSIAKHLKHKISSFVTKFKPREAEEHFQDIVLWLADKFSSKYFGYMDYDMRTGHYKICLDIEYKNTMGWKRWPLTYFNTHVNKHEFTVSMPIFVQAFLKLLGREGQSELDQTHRFMYKEYVTPAKTHTKGDDGETIDATEYKDINVVMSSTDFANQVAARFDVMSMELNASVDVQKANALRKKNLDVTHGYDSSQRAPLSFYLMKYFTQVLAILIVACAASGITYGLVKFGPYLLNKITTFAQPAHASSGFSKYNDYLVEVEGVLFIWIFVFLGLLWRYRRSLGDEDANIPERIASSCVTVKERLCLASQAGRVDAEFKIRDYEYDIRGMTGQQADHYLGCSKRGEVLATQIGPMFHGDVKRTPTIKHNCKQTVWAAATRACSNKIEPAPAALAEWKDTLMDIGKDFQRYIDAEGGGDILYSDWLAKYPLAYQANMERTRTKADRRSTGFGHYESFPKIEMQYTNLAHDLKDTEANDVKERQISAPTNDKKIAAGAFCLYLEGVAHRNLKPYCGRKNWMQICEGLDEVELQFQKILWGSADASGFDMTQVQVLQKAFTCFMSMLIYYHMINWDVCLDPDAAYQAFRDSEMLCVSVARGAFSYKAEGRASGDSWTTFGNTVMNISYWLFAFKKFGFNPKGTGLATGYKSFYLLIKGDDVLFAVEESDKELAALAISTYFAKKNEPKAYGLGLVVKDVKWGPIEDMDFLSCYFWRTNHGISMTRKLQRLFQTNGLSGKVLDDTRDKERLSKWLLWSKAMCLLAWCKGLPLLETLARRMLILGLKPADDFVSDYCPHTDAGRVWDDDRDRADAFYCFLWDKYNVSRAEVDSLEQQIVVMRQYDVLYHPVIEKFYAAD
jgi:hypothetical protein